MLRRWGSPIALLLLAVPVALYSGTGAVIPVLILLAGAVIISPLPFPRTAARPTAPVTVYWRPGCPYCLRLRASLGRDAARLRWIDIWADPAAAATVRSVADGNETVPTVIAGDRSWVNPPPALVRDLLRAS